MKGKFGKIGIISLALVLALGSLGGAFAYWNETLTVSAPVNTGYLELKLTDTFYEDNETDKDVGKVECSLERGGGGNAFTELKVKVLNAYPGYEATIHLDVKNTGTIPLRLDSGCCICTTYSRPAWLHLDTNDICNFGGFPITLAPGESNRDGHIVVTIGEGEGCPEDFYFDGLFTITLQAVQFNAP